MPNVFWRGLKHVFLFFDDATFSINMLLVNILSNICGSIKDSFGCVQDTSLPLAAFAF
jgi:hypothetical protein